MWVPALWGAQCDPPPPPCGGCPATQISECVGLCTRAIPRDDATTCFVDPCMGALCDYGLTCIAGTCRSPAVNEGLFCLTTGNPCPTGNYCRRYGAGFPRPNGAPIQYDGQCVTPAVEGASCDGAWAQAASGLRCEAGLECLIDPRSAGSRACFRGCTASSDCACASPEPEVLDDCVVNHSGSGPSNICGHCVANGASAGEGDWACCDPASTGATGACCHPDLSACTSSAECCAGSACGSDGRCHTCPGVSGAIDPAVGCCSLEAFAGRCRVPCDVPVGEACTPLACPTNPNGTWTCPDTGPFCRPNTGAVEACNGVDDDCNGEVDDITPAGVTTNCTAPPPPLPDSEACARMFSGRMECVGGAPTCVVGGWCQHSYDSMQSNQADDVTDFECHHLRWVCNDGAPLGPGNATCPPGSACVNLSCPTSPGMSLPPDLVCVDHNTTHPCPLLGTNIWTDLGCTGTVCWSPEDFGTETGGGSFLCQ